MCHILVFHKKMYAALHPLKTQNPRNTKSWRKAQFWKHFLFAQILAKNFDQTQLLKNSPSERLKN